MERSVSAVLIFIPYFCGAVLSKGQTRTSHRANSSATRSSMPSSSNSSRFAVPMWEPLRLTIPYVNAWNAFCPNSLSFCFRFPVNGLTF